MAHKSTYRARNLKALIQRRQEQRGYMANKRLMQVVAEYRDLLNAELQEEARARLAANVEEAHRRDSLTLWQRFREYFAI